jgi:hypothetical protein
MTNPNSDAGYAAESGRHKVAQLVNEHSEGRENDDGKNQHESLGGICWGHCRRMKHQASCQLAVRNISKEILWQDEGE